MCNNKLLILLSLHTVSGFALLFMVSLLTKSGFLSPETYVINGIITTVAIVVSLIFTVLYNINAKSEKLTKLDVALPLIFSIALYGLYLLPPLGFIGLNGVNNSVLSAFFFLIAGNYLNNFGYYINSRKRTRHINNRSNPVYTNRDKGIYVGKDGTVTYNYDSFKFIGIMFYLAGLFVSVFNIFKPIIDLSSIFSMYYTRFFI